MDRRVRDRILTATCSTGLGLSRCENGSIVRVDGAPRWSDFDMPVEPAELGQLLRILLDAS